MNPPRGIVGVVHLRPMPGDPGCDPDASGVMSYEAVADHALRDAEAMRQGGIRSIVVENFGSTPFPKGTAGHRTAPHHVAAMALIAARIREGLELNVGINCLRNDAYSAIGIASATGASFVRINVHTGAYITDQGLIEGDAHHTLHYRSQLRCPCAILADVLVKHAKPMAPTSAAQAALEALDRGRADAVIVTGDGTGTATDVGVLEEVRVAIGDRSLLVGSGMTPKSVSAAKLSTGAIVGTYLKDDGVVQNSVSAERVQRIVDALSPHFRSSALD